MYTEKHTPSTTIQHPRLKHNQIIISEDVEAARRKSDRISGQDRIG
jgi:hypothetical protein